MDIEQYISELTRIVKAFAPTTAKILDRRRLESSKLGWASLYRGFVEGSVVTERTGKKALTSQGGSDSSYYTQRSMLKSRLINTLFILDLDQVPGTSPVLKAKYHIHRKLFLINIMLLMGMRKFGIALAKNTLRDAQEWQLTLAQIEIVSLLRIHSSIVGSRQDHEKYKHEVHRLLQLFEAESIAAAEYEKVNLLFARSATEKPQLAPQFEAAAEHVSSLAKSYNTFELDLAMYRLRMAAKQIALEFDQTLAVCGEACAVLSAKWPMHFDKIRLGEFNLMRLLCAAHLRSLERAESLLTECEKSYGSGSNNWFVLQENYMLALTQCFQFERAAQVLRTVVTQGRFGSQSRHIHERWKLFELFLSFTGPRSPTPKEFEMTAGELRSLDTDKGGYKVCIIVLRILALLRQRKQSEIIELLESLRSYRARSFKKRDVSPGSAILDLILIASEHGFVREPTLAAAGDIPRRLKGKLTFLTRKDGFVSLPFDWIWDEMVNVMPDELPEQELRSYMEKLRESKELAAFARELAKVGAKKPAAAAAKKLAAV